MAFGDSEDELWGVLKPIFRPKAQGDPNAAYVANIINGTGPFARARSAPRPAGDARATLSRVVRKAPEVLVKVTGRKKGAGHVVAHLDYIGRKGDLALETRDGELISDKAAIERIAEEWSDPLYWRQGTTVSAVSMVFSMPTGTDPETVKQAVRETADRLLGDNHDYVMALHTDTPRPHVHLTVQAEGIDRQRFDPRREDLFKFREAFAGALRSRGVVAEATPRWSRGEGRAGASMALTQMRAKIRSGASRQPTEADMRQAREAMSIALGKGKQPAFVARAKARWAETRQRYATAADRLETSKNPADRTLAREVRDFLNERPTIETVPDRVLKDAERRVAAAQKQRDARGRDGPSAPERPTPTRRR